jgi:serine/threonine-protein kinase
VENSNPQFVRLSDALADRYRIERLLGEGGMATVYLAEDLKHKRNVALKVLKPELAAVLGADRFVQEITTTAALQHPHILPLFDSGTADGFLYYVMPFIDGETLRTKLNRETQIGIDEAVRITTQVADALDYAHRHGVIHRDIKPENVLLHDGRPMVADFGIALAVSAAAGGRMTETGLSLGTPHYMSPEQATAEKEITARSDVYSLASVLYEMLTGSPPHTGASAQQIIMKIVTEEAAPVTKLRRSVPPNVAAAIAKSLEKMPADRFDSAKAFADALLNPSFATAGDSPAHGLSGTLAVPRWVFAGVGAIALLVIGGATWKSLRSPSATPGPVRYLITLADSASPGFNISRDLAMSPDGRTSVFSRLINGQRQLWVKNPEQVSADPLAGTSGGRSPVFSPDGESIAFVADTRLRKLNRRSGAVETVADAVAPRSLAWLDDGTLLFSGSEFDLRSVDQNGGPVRVVIARDSLPNRVVHIAGIAGSRTAVFVTCSSNCAQSQLFAVDLRSSARTQLLEGVSQVWSSNGVVAYSAHNGGRDGRIFAAPFDEKNRKFRVPPTLVLEGVQNFGGETNALALSTNGTLLFQPAEEVVVRAVWVGRDGTVTPADTTWTPPSQSNFSLSSDGRRMAVVVENGSSSDIWIKDLKKGAFTRLTFEGQSDRPEWTPDGQSVMYSVRLGDGSYQLKRRRADGADTARILVRSPREIATIWPLRDSMQILARLGASPTRDIYLAQLGHAGADGKLTPLLANDSYEEVAMNVSPDQHWLAYVSTESGKMEVYVRPFPNVNSGRWQVSLNGGRSPRWAHSGRELFFRTLDENLVDVPISEGPGIQFGERRTLFPLKGFTADPVQPAYEVSPDDRRFLFLQRVGSSAAPTSTTAVLVQNWLAELKMR